MLIDYVKIKIKSGNGGNGCVSFRREKFVPRGGPNGGDGGKGGDIIFQADNSLSTLLDLKYKKNYKAENGRHGLGGDKTGRNGKDMVIKVPCGSVLKNFSDEVILADLVNNNQRFIAAKGGKGGRGNAHFATPTNQTPRNAESGNPGVEKELIIELKLIADVGLVGLPNSGKSTLISKISSAKPKIADYPFTTLQPNLGIVKYREYKSFVVADIPGLIEGAHLGKGLGIRFLKHIERTRVIVFLIDSTILQSNKNPTDDYKILLTELESYDIKLLNKPRIICFSKIDALTKKQKNDLKNLKLKKIKPGSPILMISSISGENIPKLIDEMWYKINE